MKGIKVEAVMLLSWFDTKLQTD